MSPRTRTPRRVSNPPDIKGFRPFGLQAGITGNTTVNLLFEEYEALRLADYDRCNHEEASRLMGISRPTFTRIYAEALQKIARAFVEGRKIVIEGGHVYFDSNWYHCAECDCHFNDPEREAAVNECPLCGSGAVSMVDEYREKEVKKRPGTKMVYVCQACQIEQVFTVEPDQPQPVCESCHQLMRPKSASGCNTLKSCL